MAALSPNIVLTFIVGLFALFMALSHIGFFVKLGSFLITAISGVVINMVSLEHPLIIYFLCAYVSGLLVLRFKKQKDDDERNKRVG